MTRSPAAASRRGTAALAAILLLAACSTDVVPTLAPSPGPIGSPASAAPTPSAALPSSSPSPTTSPPTAAHFRWTKTVTNLPIGVARTGVTALAVRPGSPPLYVAVSADHRVWLSTDGVKWRQGGPLTPPTVDGDLWMVNQVLVVGSTFVALGGGGLLEDAGMDGPYSWLRAGYAWTSTDGEAWAGTKLPSFAIGNAMVEGGRVVGTGGLTRQFQPTFAVSADGVSWDPASIAGDPWPADPTRFAWYDVRHLAGSQAAGYLVLGNHYSGTDLGCQVPVAGYTPSPTITPEVPIIWRSTDLRQWQPVATAAIGCASMRDLVAGPAGAVALSGQFQNHAAEIAVRAWVSKDGVTWREIAAPPGPLRWIGSLAIAADGTFLLIGDGIWESVDGEHWFLSAPAKGINVMEFAGRLALGCAHDTCSALRIAAFARG